MYTRYTMYSQIQYVKYILLLLYDANTLVLITCVYAVSIFTDVDHFEKNPSPDIFLTSTFAVLETNNGACMYM